MKKVNRVWALLLAAALLLALASCGGEKKPETTDPTEGKTPVELFETIWNTLSEDQKFPSFGGDYENSVSDKPAAFSGSADTFDSLLGIPTELFSKIDGVASLMHLMNANTFTGAILHFAKAEDADASAESIKNHILDRQWMCGFPDKVIVINLGGGNLLTAFGIEDAVDPIRDAALALQKDAKVLEAPIA